MGEDATEPEELNLAAHAARALALADEHVRLAHRLTDHVAKLPGATDDDARLLDRMSGLVEEMKFSLEWSQLGANTRRMKPRGKATVY